MLDTVKAVLLFSCFFSISVTPVHAVEDAVSCTAFEPVYVLIMNHVEGDWSCRYADKACLNAIEYQTAPLPPPGIEALPSYALDVAGNNLIYDILLKYRDSSGNSPKLFIEPAGEWWQTYSHPIFGGKAFDRYDYSALGNEFGIQGHAIYYSGFKLRRVGTGFIVPTNLVGRASVILVGTIKPVPTLPL